ncbi:MAG: hypothetical protein PHE79_02940 [Eubacteriales bacterium]|nr:hypothetical protein [Eubacteriales bacterium]
MKKIKDIFYDLNDILVALIIVVAAAFVIVQNIDTIMAYPSIVYDEIQNSEYDLPTDYAENPPLEGADNGTTGAGMNIPNSDQQGSGDGGGASGHEGTGTTEPVNHSVYIASGSTGEKIADTLIKAGLFESRQEFLDAVTAAGAEGKLQAGNFTIPSDATPAEVVSIITK